MTPFELDILLHYHTRCEDHEVLRRNPPVWPSTLESFKALGLMEPVPPSAHTENYTCTYRLTDRGQTYIEAVLQVPLPVQRWVMPVPQSWADELNSSSDSKATQEKS